ncbi:MAG TPA: RNase adapter RapZ, partial [Gammaproteobacteria bacterium]|nr:RNase adapter RapZ [Gammaproteobacteria bacterium]
SFAHPRLAVSIDARNLPKDLNELKCVISELKKPEMHCEILYLDSDENVILARFSETRRRHPLTRDGLSLQEAIRQEKFLLSPLSHMADVTIDTTNLTKHQLCSLIFQKLANEPIDHLQVLLQSFGFKNGIPSDADFIFDVRCLPNPYWAPNLRLLTGLDKEVSHFLQSQPEVNLMIEDILVFLNNWIPKFKANNRSYLTVGIGCTGGQHRSVYIAEKLSHSIHGQHKQVHIRHRDLLQVK